MSESLLTLDRSITLALNGSDSLFADRLMLIFTSTLTWVPVGILLLYIIIRNNDLPHVLSIFAALVLCVAISSSLSEICKALVLRPRPCNDLYLMGEIATANGYTCSGSGFFSAHSANTMALAVFLALLFRRARSAVFFFLWSIINGWSRIYLGVHYFGDVITGFAVGAIVGSLLFLLYKRISRHMPHSSRVVSSEYTRSGYLAADIDLLASGLLLTAIVVCIIATAYPAC